MTTASSPERGPASPDRPHVESPGDPGSAVIEAKLHRRKRLIAIIVAFCTLLAATAVGTWGWRARPLAEGNLKFFHGNLYLKSSEGSVYLLVLHDLQKGQWPVPSGLVTGQMESHELENWYAPSEKNAGKFYLNDSGPVFSTFSTWDTKQGKFLDPVGPSAVFAVYGELIERPSDIGGFAGFEDLENPKTIRVKRIELRAKN